MGTRRSSYCAVSSPLTRSRLARPARPSTIASSSTTPKAARSLMRMPTRTVPLLSAVTHDGQLLRGGHRPAALHHPHPLCASCDVLQYLKAPPGAQLGQPQHHDARLGDAPHEVSLGERAF